VGTLKPKFRKVQMRGVKGRVPRGYKAVRPASFLDPLIPFLRDSTSLENTINNSYIEDAVEAYLIVGMLSPSSDLRASSSSTLGYSSRIPDRLIRKASSPEGKCQLVIIQAPDFHGKPHALGWR